MDKWSIFESFGSWSHMWSLSLFRSDDGIVVRKQCTYEQSTMLSVGRMYTAALIPPITCSFDLIIFKITYSRDSISLPKWSSYGKLLDLIVRYA